MAKGDVLTVPGVPKVITPAQHAIVDYSVATTFFALGARYSSYHREAAALAFLNGAMVLGLSLLTDYPGGVWRRISFPMHGALDLMQAALAGVGPALMGFADEPEARVFYSQAASELGVVAATDWRGVQAV